MASGFYSRPSPSFGYWRGGGSDGVPLAGGQGSGMGQSNSGLGLLSQGQGMIGGASDWHPTVIYLLVLVLAEMIVFGFIAKTLR
jgi:hypothetical protein